MSGNSRVQQSTASPADPQRVAFPNGSYGNLLNREHTPATMTAINGSQPNGQYTFRAPSPPHIHIPQVNDDHKFTLACQGNSGYSGQDEAILARVAAQQEGMAGVVDWKYENRRKAQKILPFLYLGASSSARDIDFLRAEGITMLLVVRNTLTAQTGQLSGKKAATELGIESATVDVAGNQELIAAFPTAVKIINDHLISAYRRLAQPDDEQAGRTTWGKILVFCESGNERSAAVMAAYLMNTFSLGMVAAIQYVQSQRFCVAYDDGLKNLLQAYDDILSARRSVTRSTSAAPPQAVTPHSKRRRDDVDEDGDMDMGDLNADRDDVGRFAGRGAYAPFRDDS